MTWYKTGTATVTNGSPTVTLAGANAQLNIFPDDGFVGPDGRLYAVLSVASATTFTLSTNYSGPTASAQPYLAVPVADHVQLRDLLISVNTLVGDYQTIANEAGAGRFPDGTAASPGVKGINRAGTGLVWSANALSVSVNGTIVATFNANGSTSVITFPDGTVGAPGMRFTGDTNTGIYRPSSDNISIVAGGTERIRFTPTYIVTGHLFQWLRCGDMLGGSDVPLSVSQSTGDIQARFGALSPGVNPFIRFQGQSAAAQNRYGDIQLDAENGVFTILAPASGGPTNKAFNINTAGNVGIGTTNPAGYWSSASHLVVKGSGNVGMSIDGSNTSRVAFVAGEGVTPGLTSGGLITYLHPSNRFEFRVAGVDRLVLDSTGLMPGTTNNSQALGSGSLRWSVVYAGTGTINTSDQNEKTTLRSFTSAELTASRRIAKIIGIFQWLASVAEKGEDNARHHVGVIAQDVWGIMADEGLIAPLIEGETPSTKYGFLCYDEWEEKTEPVMEEITIPAVMDDDGEVIEPEHTEQQPTGETRVTMEAGKRFGIRPDQLAMFLIAAQEARLTALEESL